MTDATWRRHPASGDFSTGSNWTGGVVPDGTAFFATSKITHLSLSAATNIGGLTFNKVASHYTLDIPTAKQLTVDSGGIVIKGGGASFTNEGTFTFQSITSAFSSAGKAHILNTGGRHDDQLLHPQLGRQSAHLE